MSQFLANLPCLGHKYMQIVEYLFKCRREEPRLPLGPLTSFPQVPFLRATWSYLIQTKRNLLSRGAPESECLWFIISHNLLGGSHLLV